LNCGSPCRPAARELSANAQNGVTIDSSPAPAVVAALNLSVAAQQAWCTRSGPACPQVLEASRPANREPRRSRRLEPRPPKNYAFVDENFAIFKARFFKTLRFYSKARRCSLLTWPRFRNNAVVKTAVQIKNNDSDPR